MGYKTQQVKRAKYPGELINSTKVAAGPFDGTVSMCTLSQSSHLKHCVGVKEDVRGAALGSTSDLSKMGDIIMETRSEVGHSEMNVALMHTSSILT